MSVIAAVAWTYWMALPTLVLTACALTVFTLVYLKKVLEPRLLREDQLRVLELVGARAAATGAGTLTEEGSPEALGGANTARARALAARRRRAVSEGASHGVPADAGR